MKFRPLFLFVFLLLAVQSWAGGLMGGSYDDCVNKLGQPVKHLETGNKIVSDLWTFEQGDWSIEVGIWDKNVHLISYKHKDGKQISANEVKALLAGFGDGFAWKQEGLGSYRRTDDKMKAKTTQEGLSILTTELARNL